MADKFTEKVRQTAREIIRNLVLAKIDVRSSREKRRDRDIESKKRVEELLEKSKAREEIVGFLSIGGYKRRQKGGKLSWFTSDFLLALVKEGRHVLRSLKVESSIEGADRYWKIEEKRRERFGEDFIETQVLVANPQKSDEQLEKDWQKILTHFIKS